jgi:hypothetical protein
VEIFEGFLLILPPVLVKVITRTANIPTGIRPLQEDTDGRKDPNTTFVRKCLDDEQDSCG